MARILASTVGMSHENWLRMRRGGIGGSDAAAAVGKDRFRSRLALWAEKTGRSKGVPDNGRMRLGRDLEGYVAERFCEATGKSVSEPKAIFIHDEFDCIIANIDREIVGENAGLECKTANCSYSKLPDKIDDLPPYYLAQCYHYLNVMKYERMYLAVLDLASGELRVFEIPYDERRCAELLAAELEFWNQYVTADVRPEPDGSDSSEEALRLLCEPVHDECRELFKYENTAAELFAVRGSREDSRARGRGAEASSGAYFGTGRLCGRGYREVSSSAFTAEAECGRLEAASRKVLGGLRGMLKG